ncbi:hypothetical protein KUCAC02_013118 [Chaenocephalus aceratus]|uniref:Uncharacterized protein n=1 Tax=Chaenocephalus aceratus TaxID=36190 RepID=A0ACB9XET5_CHAAC|nr:hypothetical protein KUCAC02_013118 [Chaenocephalus aceratus]
MEHSFAELLSDAFSETAVPSFSDGDLDFEKIHFEDKCEEDETDICAENIHAQKLLKKQYDDISDNEDFEGAWVRSSIKILEEDYTSSESEQEGSVSEQYEVAEAEDMGTGAQPESFFRSVSCSDEFCVGNKEDRVFAEGQPLALEGAENPQVRKEEQGEGDEEVSYFERVPERSNEMMLRAVAEVEDGGETGENDSYTSSDDYVQEKRSDEELFDITPLQEPESNNKLKDTQDGDSAASYDEYKREDAADFSINLNLDVLTAHLSEDLLTTEDIDEVTQHFQMKRIRAFYEYYDDSDEETRRRERQIKVQFCADPLSQVIHYETDDSDRDSHSSSTEGEEDLSSAETSEELREIDVSREMTPACDTLNTQPPENMPDISDTHICSRKQKCCFNMLKLTLKMCVVILTGLLMFWLASDQAGWFI